MACARGSADAQSVRHTTMTGLTALAYLDSSLTVVNVCALLSPDLLYDLLYLLSIRAMIVYGVLVLVVSIALLAAN